MNTHTIDWETVLFLDLETVPLWSSYADMDERGKALWARKWESRKASLRSELSAEEAFGQSGIWAEFGKIVCIGLGYAEARSRGWHLTLGSLSGHDENALLRSFLDILQRMSSKAPVVLCAHNGREFDFPYLCRRLLTQGFALPEALRLQGKKPWEVRHLDTLEGWKFGDHKNYTSLDLISYALGMPSPKTEMDGSHVAGAYYGSGDLEAIARYCRADVETLARVAFRLYDGIGAEAITVEHKHLEVSDSQDFSLAAEAEK
jgi:hypothetical protein